jgi:hypothetical protein
VHSNSVIAVVTNNFFGFMPGGFRIYRRGGEKVISCDSRAK